MKIERTGTRLEARLAIRGIGRFFSAAFLAFWLAGWAAGEAFALWILAVGARSVLTGEPPGAGQKPMSPEMALGAGLFLLFWLALWTIGGIAAWRELLRLLFGRDRILAQPDCVEVEQSCGLFRRVKRLPREGIRRFYRMPGSAALCVETASGTTELTRLGTPAERAELEQTLNAEFHCAAQPEHSSALPKDWCEVISLERDAVLVKDPAVRRKQARTMWIICAVLSMVPVYLISAARERLDFGAVLFFFVLTAAAGWGATWLSFGRKEWRLAQSRLILQRRFGHNRKLRFEAASLELVEDNSGEGGPTYSLMAVAAGAPAPTRTHNSRKHRRTIHRESDDPTEPRNFGLWLSHRCQLPFADLTTAQAKAREWDALKEQLASSGRLGRVALRVIERLAPPPPRSGA
jgi:hypothetical protein